MPHILGSAYLLGSTNEHLDDIYDREAKDLEGWKDAPGEVTGDWRDYLGKREYVHSNGFTLSYSIIYCFSSFLIMIVLSSPYDF